LARRFPLPIRSPNIAAAPLTCTHIHRTHTQLVVEVETLHSGRIFGQGGAGAKRHRVCSAVADTRADCLQLSRADVRAHLGEDLVALWDGERNPSAAVRALEHQNQRNALHAQRTLAHTHMTRHSRVQVSDAAVRTQLEKTLKWELYKKKVAKDVYVSKRQQQAGGSNFR
jgi:hypothetical protein